jgi:hypothetical protein
MMRCNDMRDHVQLTAASTETRSEKGDGATHVEILAAVLGATQARYALFAFGPAELVVVPVRKLRSENRKLCQTARTRPLDPAR